MTNERNVVCVRHIEDLALATKRYTLKEVLAVTEAVSAELESVGGLSEPVATRVNDYFSTTPELQDRYAETPFEEANIVGLDLSRLVDGTNFELDNTRIRSGSASYNVANGISRGYVEVKTLCKCTLTVTYSISSQSSYDFGGCIVTENAPNTTFTYANLKAANFFYKSGSYSNQTATYTLAANKTYYLNFGYAKNASTNTGDDRFYIQSIRVVPETSAESKAEYAFNVSSELVGGNKVLYGKTSVAAGGQISMASSASLSGSFKVTGSPTFTGSPSFSGTSIFRGDPTFSGTPTFSKGLKITGGGLILGNTLSTLNGALYFQIVDGVPVLKLACDGKIFSYAPQAVFDVYIDTTADNACIQGGAGNDTLLAYGSNPTVYGLEGDDSIYAQGRYAYIDGGEGDDSITGDNGATIYPGTGNDSIELCGLDEGTLIIYSGGKDTICDFSDIDTLNFSNTSSTWKASVNTEQAKILITVGNSSSNVITLNEYLCDQFHIKKSGSSDIGVYTIQGSSLVAST